MKHNKQKKALECFDSGRYRVIQGRLHTFRKAKNVWSPVALTVLPSGYRQVQLFNFKRGDKGIKVVCYHHIAVYLLTNGLYKEGLEIGHKDNNNQNDMPDNLHAITHHKNIMDSKRNGGGSPGKIRGNEIQSIKKCIERGMSQAATARLLGLNRLSVRYTIKKIQAGEQLKFENWTKPKHSF